MNIDDVHVYAQIGEFTHVGDQPPRCTLRIVLNLKKFDFFLKKLGRTHRSCQGSQRSLGLAQYIRHLTPSVSVFTAPPPTIMGNKHDSELMWTPTHKKCFVEVTALAAGTADPLWVVCDESALGVGLFQENHWPAGSMLLKFKDAQQNYYKLIPPSGRQAQLTEDQCRADVQVVYTKSLCDVVGGCLSRYCL